jgi:hypothetical protein
LPAGGSTELNYAFVFTQDSLGCDSGANQMTCLLNSAQKDNQRVKHWYDNNSFSSCLDLSQVGIHKLKNQSIAFNLYPNPTAGNLYVNLISPQQNVTIEVYDMLGNIIGGYQYAQLDNYAVIPVSNIASGVYFIKVKTNSGIAKQKFVME